MAAVIESKRNGLDPIIGGSRNDLRPGDTMSVEAVGASTYAWTLVFAPREPDGITPSSAVLSGTTGPGPHTFTVDNEGAYLVRLVTDAGTGSEDVQYVRLRFLTKFGDLKLVAAGERRDGTGIIPVDVSADGWANDQNFNLQTLLGLVQRVSSSGRIIYVDANRGPDYSNTPDDPAVAEDYADFSDLDLAITAAITNPTYNGGVAPSKDDPMIIAVRPGLYTVDCDFRPYVHIIGHPTLTSKMGDSSLGHDSDRVVTIRTASAGSGSHTVTTASADEYIIIGGVHIENRDVTTTGGALVKTGPGTLYIQNSHVVQNRDSATQGPALEISGGSVFGLNTKLVQNANATNDRVAVLMNNTGATSASLNLRNSHVEGTSGLEIGTDGSTTMAVALRNVNVVQVGAGAASFAFRSIAQTNVIRRSQLELNNGGTDAVEINPVPAVAITGNVDVEITDTRLGPTNGALQGIYFDTTGITGTSTLRLGNVSYSALATPGIPPLTDIALPRGESIYYDDTLALPSIAAANVQEAIDAIKASAGGAGEVVISRQMIVPVGIPPPPANTIINEFDVLSFSLGFTPTAIHVYVDVAITPPATYFLEVFAKDSLGIALPPLTGVPFDVTTVPPGTIVAVPVVGPSLPPISSIQVELTNPFGPTIATGDGLVVAVRGTSP